MSIVSTLTNTAYLGTTTSKSLIAASIFAALNYYLNGSKLGGKAFWRVFGGSFVSSAGATIGKVTIIDRLLNLASSNPAVAKIMDQGLESLLAGGINVYAYKILIKDGKNIDGSEFDNHEEFVYQVIGNFVGDLLTDEYVAPYFGFDQKTSTNTYGK